MLSIISTLYKQSLIFIAIFFNAYLSTITNIGIELIVELHQAFKCIFVYILTFRFPFITHGFRQTFIGNRKSKLD